MIKILIVDDEKNTRDALRDGLQKPDERKIYTAENARENLNA
jgi:YesN/AraC family two-component response regulator